MTRNTKIVSVVGIVAALAVISLLIGRDLWLKHPDTFDCGDGPRRRIDLRDFTTQYSAYSVELAATVSEKAKLSAKLTPVQLQQVSDSLQSSNEFRKSLVAGYDGCAITKAQYADGVKRFEAMDGLAREINQLIGKDLLSQDETAQLADLIGHYNRLTGVGNNP